MRVEEIIGMRMRQRREELDRTQEELGRELGVFLGKPWSRQSVSSAEQGKRAFTAAEIYAIANCLRMTFVSLLRPPTDVAEVEMPSGETLPSYTFIGATSNIPDDNSHAARAEVKHLLDELDAAHRDASTAVLGAKVTTDLARTVTDALRSRLVPKEEGEQGE